MLKCRPDLRDPTPANPSRRLRGTMRKRQCRSRKAWHHIKNRVRYGWPTGWGRSQHQNHISLLAVLPGPFKPWPRHDILVYLDSRVRSDYIFDLYSQRDRCHKKWQTSDWVEWDYSGSDTRTFGVCIASLCDKTV